MSTAWGSQLSSCANAGAAIRAASANADVMASGLLDLMGSVILRLLLSVGECDETRMTKSIESRLTEGDKVSRHSGKGVGRFTYFVRPAHFGCSPDKMIRPRS